MISLLRSRRALATLVPLPLRSRVGESLNELRLRRTPRRPLDFGDLARLSDLDAERMLEPASFEEEWRAVDQRIRVEVLRNARVVHGANPGDQRALYQFVRHRKPRRVLEIGTGFGLSALYIAAALMRNAAEGAPDGHLTSVDIDDVNDPIQRPWLRHGLTNSPRRATEIAGSAALVDFVVAQSGPFLASGLRRFDFVYLDGSTAAADVYRDLQNLPSAISPGAMALIHVFFPHGRALWPGEVAITGPWRAMARLQAEGAGIAAQPLGELPWTTKKGGRTTSLALIGRSAATRS